MQKITPFLWFDSNAEEAMNFYVSVFKNSKVINLSRNAEGKVFTGTFQIEGQTFHALNGGPMYKFTEAISLFVDCETQAEVDELWNKLTVDGGQESRCGWLKDKYGVSWQITPTAYYDLMARGDEQAKQRLMNAVMATFGKFDLAALEAAYGSEDGR